MLEKDSAVHEGYGLWPIGGMSIITEAGDLAESAGLETRELRLETVRQITSDGVAITC